MLPAYTSRIGWGDTCRGRSLLDRVEVAAVCSSLDRRAQR